MLSHHESLHLDSLNNLIGEAEDKLDDAKSKGEAAEITQAEEVFRVANADYWSYFESVRGKGTRYPRKQTPPLAELKEAEDACEREIRRTESVYFAARADCEKVPPPNPMTPEYRKLIDVCNKASDDNLQAIHNCRMASSAYEDAKADAEDQQERNT